MRFFLNICEGHAIEVWTGLVKQQHGDNFVNRELGLVSLALLSLVSKRSRETSWNGWDFIWNRLYGYLPQHGRRLQWLKITENTLVKFANFIDNTLCLLRVWPVDCTAQMALYKSKFDCNVYIQLETGYTLNIWAGAQLHTLGYTTTTASSRLQHKREAINSWTIVLQAVYIECQPCSVSRSVRPSTHGIGLCHCL